MTFSRHQRTGRRSEPPMHTWWRRFKRWCERRGLLPPSPAGVWGEEQAATYVQRRGLVVIARNWRNPADLRDEIDLVCREGDTLVFVEVKTRAASALVPGYYTVNGRKKAALRRVCTAYLRRLRPCPRTFRLDVVEVSVPPHGEPKILHFENVPLFSRHFLP